MPVIPEGKTDYGCIAPVKFHLHIRVRSIENLFYEFVEFYLHISLWTYHASC
jgi:hypothetical protein